MLPQAVSDRFRNRSELARPFYPITTMLLLYNFINKVLSEFVWVLYKRFLNLAAAATVYNDRTITECPADNGLFHVA